jgi:hypothetical protein
MCAPLVRLQLSALQQHVGACARAMHCSLVDKRSTARPIVEIECNSLLNVSNSKAQVLQSSQVQTIGGSVSKETDFSGPVLTVHVFLCINASLLQDRGTHSCVPLLRGML